MPLLGVGESRDAMGDTTGELVAGGEASKVSASCLGKSLEIVCLLIRGDSLHIAKA
jgi:hypothetical protein